MRGKEKYKCIYTSFLLKKHCTKREKKIPPHYSAWLVFLQARGTCALS